MIDFYVKIPATLVVLLLKLLKLYMIITVCPKYLYGYTIFTKHNCIAWVL